MYLTQFAMNPVRRGAQKLLASPHAMHAAVSASFPPDAEPLDTGRVLWRVDRNVHDTRLFVLSPSAPDLTHLIEQAGWPTRSTWDSRPYGPLLDHLAAGQRWAFRIRANPVKNAKDIGKLVGHVTVDQQAAWLETRAGRHGFQIVRRETGDGGMMVTERQKQTFRRGQGSVTLVTARFDGLLEIVNADAFRSMLVSGLGRAKGYGCGLMTIARPTP